MRIQNPMPNAWNNTKLPYWNEIHLLGSEGVPDHRTGGSHIITTSTTLDMILKCYNSPHGCQKRRTQDENNGGNHFGVTTTLEYEVSIVALARKRCAN
jgi:hypothetical protein